MPVEPMRSRPGSAFARSTSCGTLRMPLPGCATIR
jgi:hypothetical protein